MRYERRGVSFKMILFSSFLLSGCAKDAVPEHATLVIRSVTIIDGRSGSQTENVNIVIEGDRIASIGDAVPSSLASDAQIIDGNGKWVVPGFVDVHVHDASESYLRNMLAWGVTSIQLMPNVPPVSPVAMQQASEEARSRSPRLQVTKMFTGEFPDNLLPGVFQFLKPKTGLGARAAVQALYDNGYRQIKIIQDDSRLWAGADHIAPRFEKSVFDALVAGAHEHQMRVYVHATQLLDTTMAIEAGIEAFMHGTMDAALEVEQWQQMAEAQTVWAPTYHALYWYGDRRSYAQRVIGDPRLRISMPDDQLQQLEAQSKAVEPIVSEAMRTLINHTDDYVKVIAKNTQDAQASGVPIAVGSDGGPAGISTHLEMELLQENGLSPAEVLTAATYGGAAAIGRQKELGSVDVGKLADLVILSADPGTDVPNCREIDWVIKGGTAYKPRTLIPRTAAGK